MRDATVPGRFADAVSDVSPTAVGLVVATVFAELALVAGYAGVSGGQVESIRYLLYPFVWINVGIWAVFRVDPPSASTRARALAGVAALAYFLVLGSAGGLFDVAHLGHFHTHGRAGGLSVFTALPPGWGPTVVYQAEWFTLSLIPFRVIGYVALAYLAYAALLDTVTSALSGAIGLLSCVSCSLPVFASLLVGVIGGSATSALYGLSIDLSTVAFVVAVALLVWRPGSG